MGSMLHSMLAYIPAPWIRHGIQSLDCKFRWFSEFLVFPLELFSTSPMAICISKAYRRARTTRCSLVWTRSLSEFEKLDTWKEWRKLVGNYNKLYSYNLYRYLWNIMEPLYFLYPYRILTVLLYMVCHGSHQQKPPMNVSINIPAPWMIWIDMGYFVFLGVHGAGIWHNWMIYIHFLGGTSAMGCFTPKLSMESPLAWWFFTLDSWPWVAGGGSFSNTKKPSQYLQ